MITTAIRKLIPNANARAIAYAFAAVMTLQAADLVLTRLFG